MQGIIIPITSLIVGQGQNAALKTGTKAFIRRMMVRKILIVVLVKEPFAPGRITVARAFQLLGRVKLPFEPVYNECVDPISVGEHYLGIRGRTSRYTDLPFAMRECQCGKLMWPNYSWKKRTKKGLLYEKRWLCDCGLSHIEKNI